jgi:murein DD-endopeptidase MepM/ murein hydrolase activator NlpD
MKKRRVLGRISLAFIAIIGLGCLVPNNPTLPVDGASSNDWNEKSFWYSPWGKSGVHKGIDIFGVRGTKIVAASHGVVVYSGRINRGGEVVLILSPKWTLHYYAHLESRNVEAYAVVSSGEPIGTLGDSGNAKGKQAHLHYSIVSILPRIWRIDFSEQGWKKMFYLKPQDWWKNE